MREVYASHGQDRAMGYSFRCRIESRTRKTWFGWGKEISEFRAVLERYFMSWSDVRWSIWTSKENAEFIGERWLFTIEEKPEGDYV